VRFNLVPSSVQKEEAKYDSGDRPQGAPAATSHSLKSIRKSNITSDAPIWIPAPEKGDLIDGIFGLGAD
jgi:hypothetical protein